MNRQDLESIANNDELIEIARLHIENMLIDYRDSRISLLNRGNGLVIREKDGTNSYHIRMSVGDAIKMSLLEIAKHIPSSNSQ